MNVKLILEAADKPWARKLIFEDGRGYTDFQNSKYVIQ
jgi:hypothetical protein